ncbi:ammonium transporter [Methylobacter luteus]|uniref:ammonium transporter n=1 Tax=Methylobacter luteus TaxID=415 RepID=UPI0009DBA205|nr:ammonium transporter [Methylobacter luteus]
MNELQVIWMAMCVMLVFFMQAGFALLESGASRAKNSINVLMKNYMDMCLGGLIFWSVGFGLMFGDTSTGWLGTNHFFQQQFTTAEAVKLAYQTMFAATAATIVSGAVAERMHFSTYLIFSAFVTGIIYPVFGSWAWNEHGWLRALGFVDFAGSTVVHSIGGWCALAGIIVLGPRLGRYSRQGETREIPGHNLPLVALGGFILWLGWFGFNGGSISSLEKNNLGLVLLNTHLGGSAGALSALLFMYFRKQPVLLSATVNGSIAGLVSITAGAAYLSPLAAVAVGFTGGVFYLLAVNLLDRLQLDDVVGAVAVHGVGGVWGTLAVALFPQGAFSFSTLLVQMTGIVACFVWAFPTAFLFFKLLDNYLGVRASTLDEQRGLDYTEHYEVGYPEFQKRLDSNAA